MSIGSACPHGIEGGCATCIMRKGHTIATALAMLPIRSPGPHPGVRLARVNDRIILIRDGEVVIKDLEQAVTLVPEMLALLRFLSTKSFYAENGEIDDGCAFCGGSGYHVGVCDLAALLARIDVTTIEGDK